MSTTYTGKTPFAKKRFSQNFLIDQNVANRIVAAAGLAGGDFAVEIGPGRGVLTEPLLATGASLTCIEIDFKLADRLKERYLGRAGIDFIVGDALKISFIDLSEEKGKRLKLVSNLPYNISGPVLAKFLEERAAFSVMVLMFQKEVADRITAGPGTKDYGSLSVLAYAYTDVKRLFDIPPHLFRPVPKVTSTVLLFRVLEAPRVSVPDEALFKRVVRGGFTGRRKTLINSLAAAGFVKEEAASALQEAGIDPKRRGETLTPEEFSKLTEGFINADTRYELTNK